jgi:hypothetical protein
MKYHSEGQPPVVLRKALCSENGVVPSKYWVVVELKDANIDSGMHFYVQTATKDHRKVVFTLGKTDAAGRADAREFLLAPARTCPSGFTVDHPSRVRI